MFLFLRIGYIHVNNCFSPTKDSTIHKTFSYPFCKIFRVELSVNIFFGAKILDRQENLIQKNIHPHKLHKKTMIYIENNYLLNAYFQKISCFIN